MLLFTRFLRIIMHKPRTLVCKYVKPNVYVNVLRFYGVITLAVSRTGTDIVKKPFTRASVWDED